ncbi:MAG: DEAD/DEAH box helicase family protein [Nitrososphaerota archaeon]|nr:DEAD/DEAH box helicase family protein [Nitrososphaerota archaeon]
MGLKDVPLQKSYNSDVDNIVDDFYIRVLSTAIEYNRITGFFSSTMLSLAARGISTFVRNGGIMKLITGARFQATDIEAIKQAIASPEQIIKEVMLKELDEFESMFVKEHIRALAWMVANKRLEIKVAIVLSSEGDPLEAVKIEKQGIFHQKVGILKDSEGNMISFSGSNNESAHGWQKNVEEFKVFRSWASGEAEYFQSDLEKFNRFFDGKSIRTKIIEIPKAVEERLIQIAPKNFEELDLEKFEIPEPVDGAKLRPYQAKAVNYWVKNGCSGIFEMATGTGKTFTALACIDTLMKKQSKLVTVISTPYNHLCEQWMSETDNFGIKTIKLVCDSTNPHWKDELFDNVIDLENGIIENLTIYTTHTTFASSEFIGIIKKNKLENTNLKLFLVVDEVHGIGASIRRNGLIDEYDFRLGLSATPKRWFDDEGTDKIFSFFKDVVFSFPLKDAILEGFLTPYVYKPFFAFLTETEMKKYEEETRKISKAYYASKTDVERNQAFTLLCIKRQLIVRNAENKLIEFQKILKTIDPLKHCIIYSSPQQIKNVQNILNNRNVIQHKFTQQEGTKPETKFKGLSERDSLIKRFSEEVYQVLVSIKCLDEGVDVPPARIAIILDNSGNPKEYIQRRGRVLRRYPGKEIATIYDIIVEPKLNKATTSELRDIEKKIALKELQRYKEFAESANNADECLKLLNTLEKTYSCG